MEEFNKKFEGVVLILKTEIKLKNKRKLYVFKILANFNINWMLFTIQSINSYFMHYFKLQKFEFKQLIDDMTINL